MKQMPVVFSSMAIIDAEEAVAYYEQIETGLGNRFASQLLQ